MRCSSRSTDHARCSLALEALESRRLLTLAPEFVTNATDNPTGGTYAQFAVSGGKAFFPAHKMPTGTEIWVTDGTAVNTRLAGEGQAGRLSGYNLGWPRQLVSVEGKAFFAARTKSGEQRLWMSDGTSAGTFQVPNAPTFVDVIFPFGDQVAFPYSKQLWLSDGTAGGTRQVPGSTVDITISTYDNFLVVGDDIYYCTNDPLGWQLWRFVGDAENIELVFQSSQSLASARPGKFTAVNGVLFFVTNSPDGHKTLWRSDGTSGGTFQIKDIAAGSTSGEIQQLTNVNGALFFAADDGVNGLELWHSDGSAAGTTQVADIVAGAGGSALQSLTAIGDELFFVANDGVHGSEIWVSDGTTTQLLEDLAPDSASEGPTLLTAVGDKLFFRGQDGNLWSSDGTATATNHVLADDGMPILTEGWRSSGTLIYAWNTLNGKLLFQTPDRALWQTDGTASGTVNLLPPSPSGSGLMQERLVSTSEALYFPGFDEVHGTELWKSDGTPQNTSMVVETAPGLDTGALGLTALGNDIYSWSNGPTGGFTLRRSDGTAGGTTAIKEIPGSGTPGFSFLTAAGGYLYFVVRQSNNFQLWVSDGTSAGTVSIKDFGTLNVTSTGQGFLDFVEFNGQLYFTVVEQGGPPSLWTSDGTTTGTTLVESFPLLSASSYLGILGDSLFVGLHTSSTSQLWKTDGSADSATLVRSFGPRPSGFVHNDLWHFATVDSTLFFAAVDSGGIYRLWKTDGMEAGTLPLAKFGANEGHFAAFEGKLYFSNWTSDTGEELWVSDGTVEGTHLFAEIAEEGGSRPSSFTVFRGDLYFVAADMEHGIGMWRLPGELNDAPVLDTSASPTLAAITEDVADPQGSLISALLGDSADDYDGDALGIAITATTNKADGTWQYLLSGQTVWTNVGAPLPSAALLLPGTAKVRFVPEKDFSGEVKVWYRAWDQTEGSAGAALDESGNIGGTRSLSRELENATLIITPVNDAPKLNTGVAVNLDPVAEDSTPSGTLVSALLGGITDVDAGAVKGIAVSSANNIAGTWQYTLDGTNWLNFGAVSRGAVRLLAADATTRVRLLPNANFSGTASLWFFAWDQTSGSPGGTANLTPVGTTGGTTAFSTSVRQAFLSVTPVNDAPKLNTGVAVNLDPVAEDSTPSGTLVSALLGGITDVDAGAVKGIAVSSANNIAGTWQYTLDGTNWLNFGAVSRGAVRLLAADATTRVRLLPNPNFNGTTSLWFFAWDQTSGTAGGTANLTPVGTTGGTTAFSTAVRQAFLSITPVNDAPKLNTGVVVNLDPIAEDSTPAGTLVSSLLGGITDPDAGAVKGIAVSSANNIAGTWQYTLDGTNWLNFGAVSRGAVRLLAADATTRVRLLPNPNFNGTASLWFFAWDQTSGTPGGTADLNPAGTTGGATAFSTAVRQAFLSVTPVNDAPVLGGISGTTGYTLGNSAVIVAPAATVSDVDSANFDTGELRVWITDGASAANQLELTGFTIGPGDAVMQGSTQVGTRTSDGLNGNELRITLNINATKAVVQQLLRSVTFRATSTTGSRTLLFSVSDGDGVMSDERTKTVNVT